MAELFTALARCPELKEAANALLGVVVWGLPIVSIVVPVFGLGSRFVFS